MKHALRAIFMLFVLSFVPVVVACAGAKPVVRTLADDAAHLCSLFYAEKRGLNLDDAARQFCADETKLKPWLDEVLAAQRRAAALSQAVPPGAAPGAGGPQ